MTEAIIARLRTSEICLTASEIAAECGIDPREARERLIELQDAERVLMTNGFYKLSEAERVRA